MKRDPKSNRFLPLSEEEKLFSKEKRKEYLRLWQSKYRDGNRGKIRKESKERWRRNRENPEWVEKYRRFQKEWMKKKRASTPALKKKEAERHAIWYEKNREKKLEYAVLWRKKNKVKRAVYEREYIRKRVKTDPGFVLSRQLRSRVSTALYERGIWKTGKTVEMLGIDTIGLRSHLENQFKDGMSWTNRKLWHIDHIKPLAAFDLSDLAQQRLAFHYTNLQPLWARENLIKSKKYDSSNS